MNVLEISSDRFGADLKPALRLPAQSGDGFIVEVWIGRRVFFVIDGFADHRFQFGGIPGGHARKGHLFFVVAIDIGIGVI